MSSVCVSVKILTNTKGAHTNILMQKHVYAASFIVYFLYRTNTEVVADEGGRTVFLTVSRSNGLESAVSVEWETQSATAVASGETNTFFYLKSPQPPLTLINSLLCFCCSFNPLSFQ